MRNEKINTTWDYHEINSHIQWLDHPYKMWTPHSDCRPAELFTIRMFDTGDLIALINGNIEIKCPPNHIHKVKMRTAFEIGVTLKS